MDRIRGGKRDILISDGDGDGADDWGFVAVFEIQVVEVHRANRVLLKSDGIVVVVIIIGGREGSVYVLGRFVLQDTSHDTITRWARRRTGASAGRGETASELFVRVCNLRCELRVLLSQAFGNDVVNKTVTVFEFVTGLLTSQTNR